jgi:hypothetical protein
VRLVVLFFSLFALGLTAGLAQAQPAAIVLVRGADGAPPGRVTELATHVERVAIVDGLEVIRDPVAWAERRVAELGALSATRLEAFEEVEDLLVAARAATAMHQEDRALRALEEASQIVRMHADVPGSAAWIAEVETAIGITASQAGNLDDLAAAAFDRSATLDPSRGVRGAEAPPEVTARAAAILAAARTRTGGSFEVRSNAEGARVFLDDREVGILPRIVRAPVGTHVLRVEAPGRSPWGEVIYVHEGRRPPMIVELAPDELVIAARRLETAARLLDTTVVDGAMRTLSVSSVWMVRVGRGDLDRGLIVRCVEAGCEAPRRLELDDVPFVLPTPTMADEVEIEAARRRGERWLDAPLIIPPPPPPEPFWRRWEVWVGLGVILAGGLTAIIVGAQPSPTQNQVYPLDLREIWPTF